MAPRRAKHQSCRADGRGGWVTGKRRHADVGDWSRIRIDLAALLNANDPLRTPISRSALARELAVSDRTVRRWLDGTDRPSPEAQEAIRTWIAERRGEGKGER